MHTIESLERVHGLTVPRYLPRRRPLVSEALRHGRTMARRITGAAALWMHGMQARREAAAFLALSESSLRDIGLSRAELVAELAKDRAMRGRAK